MSTAFWKRMMLASAFALLATAAAAQSPCNQRKEVIGHLAKKYGEVPIAVGVTNKGGLVEVLSTGDGNTWTIIVSTPDGTSCLVAAGEAWRRTEYDSAQAAPSNIAGVTEGAGETGRAATQVLEAAGQLSQQSEDLRGAVDRFLAQIRAS